MANGLYFLYMKVAKNDLWIPCSFEERKPKLLDQFLYIPPHYREHEILDLLPADRSIAIEFCSGNGGWILQKAKEDTSIFWIAVEKKFERARKIWVKAKNQNVENLLIVFGDARTFITFYLIEDSVDMVYINFPDPWPKRRHQKNQLIDHLFAEELSRVVKPQGKAVLVTDDTIYSKKMIASMLFFWESPWGPPYYQTKWPEYGLSYFHSLWMEKGREIYFHLFTQTKRKTIFLPDDLQWSSRLELAQKYLGKGYQLLWEIDLGLQDGTFSLEDEGHFASLKILVDQFSRKMAPFEKGSLGVVFYRGSWDVSPYFPWTDYQLSQYAKWEGEKTAYSKELFCLESFLHYILLFSPSLPDSFPIYLYLDPSTLPSFYERALFFHKKRFAHFVLNPQPLCEKVGILFPENREDATLFETLTGTLKIPYRILYEDFANEQWEGLDYILSLEAKPSEKAKRILQGFCAAGGTAVTLKPQGFSQEVSLKDFGAEGFEPPTYWSQTSRASQTALCPERSKILPF